MDALTSRLDTRFLVVTVIPNVLFFGYMGFLIAAGAPGHAPSLARALKMLDGLTIRQGIIILLAVLVISVAIHPLQTPLIQLVEGYWEGLPFGSAASGLFTQRLRHELHQAADQEWLDSLPEQSAAEARRRQHWLPAKEGDLLPTDLGNTLRTGETRAGDRYGLDMEIAMPRLAPLLSDASQAELSDRRNQLDAAARLCVAAGLSTVGGLCVLLWHESWLFLPVATYVLCWACYRAAVAAARSFSVSLAVAVDLNHLQLFDALQLERPASLADEYEINTAIIGFLFRDGLSDQDMSELRYLAPKADKPSAE
jgi:hypothetical protein